MRLRQTGLITQMWRLSVVKRRVSLPTIGRWANRLGELLTDVETLDRLIDPLP
jgi:hypothetical protein